MKKEFAASSLTRRVDWSSDIPEGSNPLSLKAENKIISSHNWQQKIYEVEI